jgi:hypothetical protein
MTGFKVFSRRKKQLWEFKWLSIPFYRAEQRKIYGGFRQSAV